jgi:hypothetical protein
MTSFTSFLALTFTCLLPSMAKLLLASVFPIFTAFSLPKEMVNDFTINLRSAFELILT